jgi:sulfite exporter TauE/SafE
MIVVSLFFIIVGILACFVGFAGSSAATTVFQQIQGGLTFLVGMMMIIGGFVIDMQRMASKQNDKIHKEIQMANAQLKEFLSRLQ